MLERTRGTSRRPARPFLKWVGGKRSILPELVKRMPQHYDTYHEPFIGGGALFFAIQPKKACLSDINHRLIRTYTAVRDDVEHLITALRGHERSHNKDYYKKARSALHTEQNPTKLAALFIYLNKTCFNGLYSVNRSGVFNVSMGHLDTRHIVDEETLQKCSNLLTNINIHHHAFEHTPISKHGFYYLDPPYHGTSIKYHESGFGDTDHQKLAAFCKRIDETGAYFMLSNSDTPFIRELYQGYTIEIVRASRSLSGKAKGRGKVNELIIRNYTDITQNPKVL